MTAYNIRNNGRELYKAYHFYKHYEYKTSENDKKKIDKEDKKTTENYIKSFTQQERKLFIQIIKNPNQPDLNKIQRLDEKILKMKKREITFERKTSVLKKISRFMKNLIGKRTSSRDVFNTLKKDSNKKRL